MNAAPSSSHRLSSVPGICFSASIASGVCACVHTIIGEATEAAVKNVVTALLAKKDRVQ